MVNITFIALKSTRTDVTKCISNFTHVDRFLYRKRCTEEMDRILITTCALNSSKYLAEHVVLNIGVLVALTKDNGSYFSRKLDTFLKP